MSNAQSWAKIFAPIDPANRQAALANTWGHLAPEKNKTYKGEVLFCQSAYNGGSLTLIDTKFDLESSPWFYDSINEYINSFQNLSDGVVYKINATFRNYKWWGKPVKAISIN